MQSFLAYKRFARTVKEQYERDRIKAEALSRGNAEAKNDAQGQDQDQGIGAHRTSSIESISSETVDVAGQHEDSRDAEKGEHSPAGLKPEVELPMEEAEPAHADEAAELEKVGTTADSVGSLGTHRVDSFGTRLGTVLTGIEVRTMTKQMARTRTRHSGVRADGERESEREKVFVVGFESSSDPLNPHNWSLASRCLCTALIAMIAFIVGFASSIDSAALPQAAKELGVSEVAEALATGLFLVGFGFGALFAGPISETVGRNPVYVVTLFIYSIWIMASALAPNLGSQLVFRFLAGFFGSTPLTCAGGSLSDLWNPMERVYTFPAFANAAFMGPIFGPVVGGFIGQSSLVSWRWCEWITLILSGAILALVFLFQPETYAPVLLKWKAAHLRQLTGDDRYVAEVEIRADSFWTRLLHALYRPFLLTVREPIVILFALYLTVIYIILFTFLDGYTYIFGDTYGFSQGITGLAFIGIGIGLCGASVLVPLIYYWAKKDLAKIRDEGGTRLPPEERLWFAMLGAPAVPISLFWMAWTTYPEISFWSPLASTVLFGYGILCIFISTYQYIIDSYEVYAASALASLTLIRYVAAGAMVEVGIPFYKNLGVHWTLTILGAISALMVPVPYLFFKFGPKIRGRSHHLRGKK